MKTFRLLFIFTAALIFAVSCSEEENADMDMLSAKKTLTYDMDAWRAAMPLFCGPVQSHDLIGGQTILMGSVAVANDGTYLYVKYEADPGYVITETHLYIGDVMDGDFPRTKKGNNVKIGHFPYASENYDGSSVVVYKIALDEIEGDCFDLAAHAVVECEDGSCEETAWGAGRKSGEAIIAVKGFVKYSEEVNGETVEIRTQSYSEGILFAEDCPYYRMWGYISIDLADFQEGTFNIINSLGFVYGTVSTSIVGENLVLTFAENEGYTFDGQFVFAGALNELFNYYDSESCPEYYLFPYFTDVAELSIPLADLPVGSSEEAMDLGTTRWGFYFDYCLASCD